jgi:hypothetical protein
MGLGCGWSSLPKIWSLARSRRVAFAARSPPSLKFAISNEDAMCRFGFHDTAAVNRRQFNFLADWYSVYLARCISVASKSLERAGDRAPVWSV